MQSPQPRGLPPRIYLPVVVVIGILLVGLTAFFVADGYGVVGSVFGAGGSAKKQATGGGTETGGGPPPAVMMQVQSLKRRIAAHPKDDVALTQLGDLYLASNQFSSAIPLYERALKANPNNVAAKAGLEQARDALSQQGGS